MPAIFEHALTVGADAIDRQGHANNVEYIRWMQDAAVAHSVAQGWNSERYAQIGGTWFVRSHHIEYLKQAAEADILTIRTWVASLERVRSSRRYRIERAGELLARAETEWVWIDTAKGRPRPVPEEVAAAFEVVADPESC
jgi:acyl-CoA thioester hydrolase